MADLPAAQSRAVRERAPSNNTGTQHRSRTAFEQALYGAFIESRTLIEDAPGVYQQVSHIEKTAADEKKELATHLVAVAGPLLWTAAEDFRISVDEADAERKRQELRRHTTRAAAIQRAAQTLFDLLAPDDVIVGACRHRYVSVHDPGSNAESASDLYFRAWSTFSSRALEQPHTCGSVGDLLGLAWPTAETVRLSLGQLVRDADVWGIQAERDAKRPHCRPTDHDRLDLSVWVAVVLAHVGVKPEAGPTKTFSKVLSVVQCAAGFLAGNLVRDVKYALKQPRNHYRQYISPT